MFRSFGAPEAVIVILVLLLLFGGRKLPELARGTGRALRIFKAETKGLMADDDDEAPKPTSTSQAQIAQSPGAATPKPSQSDTEAAQHRPSESDR